MNKKRFFIVFILFLIGTGVLVYPFGSQWFEQLDQSRANEQLKDAATTAGPFIQDELREEAELFNDRIATGHNVLNDPDYKNMMLLPSTDVIGRLVVPAAKIDQPIRHTLDEPSLLAGVGHAEGTSLPIGGVNTHSVLGGHRGLAEAIGFTHLPDLKIGDEFYVESLGETLTYTVTETMVLEPEEAAVHPVEEGKDLITLLTCTPMGVNSHRFVAVGERLLPGETNLSGFDNFMPGFPWWAVAGAGGILASASIALFAARNPKQTRKSEETKTGA